VELSPNSGILLWPNSSQPMTNEFPFVTDMKLQFTMYTNYVASLSITHITNWATPQVLLACGLVPPLVHYIEIWVLTNV
jgi:hypothetical protein